MTAPSLDVVVVEITNVTNYAQLSHTLRTFAPNDVRDAILAGSLTNGQDPLTVLDFTQHTVGVLHILSARFRTKNNLPTLGYFESFCQNFDVTQAIIASEHVVYLARNLQDIAESTDSPKQPLTCLLYLVSRFPPSPSYLTPIHPIFIAGCVATGHFSMALPVLQIPITEIDNYLGDLHYNDNLVYHYAGGAAFAALKKWEEAEEFFEICVSSPAQVPAAIQLEAYKKLTLVQLISRGTAPAVPKYTNNSLVRLLKASPYGAFSKAYPQQIGTLKKVAESDAALFANDGNTGLINQALERAPRRLIKKLTSTYLTLSLAEIGKNVRMSNVDEVRALVLKMIEQDEICATISADDTVTFSDPPVQLSKTEIDQVLADAQSQAALFAALNREIGKSKEFLSKATKNKDEWGGPPEEEIYAGGNVGAWMEEA
jgi:COP9 signalosome complex subunit 3